MTPVRIPWLSYACLGGGMALVGSYVGLSKLLVGVFPVFLLAWLRFGIAAVAMAPWVRRDTGEPALTARDRKLLFWESFLGNFGFSICMLFGIALTSAVAAGVVMSAIPAAVALLSRLVFGERIAPRTAVGIGCAVLGIALLALAKAPEDAGPGDSSGGAWRALGTLLLVGAVFCEAAYVVIGKQLTGSLAPRRISALINLWGLALVTPFGVVQAIGFDFAAVPLRIWALLVFYAIAASMVTVWLWMKGMQQVPASQAGVFAVMLPISAALVGVVVLGEPFGPLHALAFLLALAGLVLATWPSRGSSAPAAARSEPDGDAAFRRLR